MFSPEDVEKLKLIYHLVKEQGMTLQGAAKCLKQSGKEIPRDVELMERLQKIRSLLLEVREELKTDEGELLKDDDALVVGRVAKSTAVKSVPKEEETMVDSADEMQPLDTEPQGDTTSEPKPQPKPKNRAPRRPKTNADEEPKELFAFYDQSLF